ncbi:efflux transporter outer membrane subunit [Azohydromonas lata]|uniref:Efflux transporter outer membrane subunit n=1 Tax=Azohydromonas lata TaxID=45677 RepID=A0ABU5IL56_9BURK|nr:efflux transporter outer membrane subunit [Azohydromonas lata]MDZ5459584.1 efflux transporter outer membrane subunit [Azohydromonas lata]
MIHSAALRRAAVLAAVALLSGCAAIRPPGDTAAASLPTDATTAVQQHAGGAASPAATASWWAQFGDPLLPGLVQEALQASPQVTSAQATLRQARALRDLAAAGLVPNVGTSASAGRNRARNVSSNQFQAGFDAGWEPDLFGRTRAGVAAAEEDAAASALSLADVQVSLAAEVAVDLITLRGLQARLAIAQANLASQQETSQIAQWRLQAGLATSLEAEQARAAAEQTQAQIPSLQLAIAQYASALAVLTGRPPAEAQAEQLTPLAAIPKAPDALAQSLPTDTLRQRPDVRAAEARVRAALARVTQADAARYPSFNLSGSLGLSALTVGGLTGPGAVVSSLLASLSLPLFDGGAINAQVRAQDAAAQQTAATLQSVALNALKEVEDALVELRSSRERQATLARAAEAASNAALLATQQYGGGLVDFQTVLQTQRTQLALQDSLASAQADAAVAHVRLYKALGGGWQPDATSTATATP